ncbi:MAG: hypothetical protein GY851_26350 [bacterium]|nr:hypothetical protein [bacterium]
MTRNPFRSSTLLSVFILALGAAVPTPSHAAEETVRPRKPTLERGIIHNEDSSHFYFAHTVDELSMDMVKGWIDQYAGTQLTHFFMCANAMRTSFRSEVWDNIWRDDDPEALIAEGFYSESGANWARTGYRLDQMGIDVYAVWIERCRYHGISPWISMRMNDCHENNNPDSWLHSRFWVDHPEYWRGGGGYFGRCLDYGAKEVRDHHMALIKEYLGRYDADGIELDWMREVFCFKPGEEEKGRAILTDFMRQVRALADEAGAKRGRRIQIAARVPAVPEASMGLGLDAVTWVREGLVDILTPTARWQTADFDIPVDEWRELLGDSADGIILAAGLENRIQPFGSSKAMGGTAETRRGFTASMLDRGADQVYLFNHMRNPKTTSVEQNRVTYNEVGALETVLEKPRRHLVAQHDISPPSRTLPVALPTEVTNAKTAGFNIHIGPAPTTGNVTVRVGVDEAPDLANVELNVKVNGADCAAMADAEHPSLYCSSLRVLQFGAPLDAMKRGYNKVEVSSKTSATQRVVWMEIYIVP